MASIKTETDSIFDRDRDRDSKDSKYSSLK
jgi:hypothetical protein